MTEIKTYLDSIDPRLFYLFVALAVGGVIFLWKKVHPDSFYRLSSKYRALPAAILGAIASASTSSELKRAVVDAVIGVFAGITAVGGHEFVTRLLSLDAKKAAAQKKASEEKKQDVSSAQ